MVYRENNSRSDHGFVGSITVHERAGTCLQTQVELQPNERKQLHLNHVVPEQPKEE